MNLPHLYRRRLINLLNEPATQTVYIFGPVGFGKSQLVRQWAETQDIPTIFFEGFSTPNAAELFTSFVEALISGLPKLEGKLLPFRTVEGLKVENIKELVNLLSREKSPFNLIIENAESIRQTHNEFSQFLVQNLPRQIKLILITATAPSPEFIRSYGVDRLLTITSEDLKFTSEEIVMLAQPLQTNLSDEIIEEILAFTGGWPAAVHLLISQLADKKDLKEAISEFKSKGKGDLSSLAIRAIASIEPKRLQLLTQLCLSHEIEPELIIGITEDNDAIRQLTLLSQECICISQIESAPPKFRIHPILRNALLDELRRRPDFHVIVEKTVKNLLDRERVREATEVLIELGETTRLTALLKEPAIANTIEISIQDSIARGAISDLHSWQNVTKYLPTTGKLGFQVLSFYVALLRGKFSEAQSHIQTLEALLSTLDAKIAQGWKSDVLALKSIIFFANGRLLNCWEAAMESYELSRGNPNRPRHQTSYLQLALWSAVLRDSDRDLKKMSGILDEISDSSPTALRTNNVNNMRAILLAFEGRYSEAQNDLVPPLTPQTLLLYKGFFGPYAVKSAEAHCLAEAGKAIESRDLFEEIYREALKGHNYPIAITTLGRLSFLYFLSGDTDGSLKAINDARLMIESELLSSELHEAIDIWEMRIRLNLMDFDRVQELLERAKPTYLVKAFEAAINIGKNPAKSRALIDTFDLKSPRQAMTFHLFSAHLNHDAPSRQLEDVRKAVEIGSRHGYFNIFLIQRSDVIQQYITLAAESPTAFNERLARTAGVRLNEMMVGQGSGAESLTRREADILRHLATGLPLKEIAGNLNISKNTIKTHLRNLYRKLGAEDRKDAVAKGKRLLKV